MNDEFNQIFIIIQNQNRKNTNICLYIYFYIYMFIYIYIYTYCCTWQKRLRIELQRPYAISWPYSNIVSEPEIIGKINKQNRKENLSAKALFNEDVNLLVA